MPLLRKPALWLLVAVSLSGCDALAELGLDPNVLTDEEAEEVVAAAFEAVSLALANARFNQVGDLQVNGVPISSTATCDAGGRINLTGDVSDNVDSRGNGSFSVTLRASLLSCGVSTSSRDLVLSGGYTASTTWSMRSFNMSGDMVTRLAGNVSWSGGSGSGSCPFSMTYTVNASTQRLTASGSSCGKSISFSD